MGSPDRAPVFHLAEAVVDPLAPPKSDQELLARIQEKLHPTGVAGPRAFSVSSFELADDEANHNPHKSDEERVVDPLFPPKTDRELERITALQNTTSEQQVINEDEYRAAVGLPPLLVGS